MRYLKMIFYFCLLTLLLAIATCKDKIVEPEEGGIGIIVPGKSIDGVNLGDSREDVEKKIGKPTAVGWADGLYRGWRTYDYMEVPHEGLTIAFIDYGDSYGPVDELLVGTFPYDDSLPYPGKTKEGIGIGSPLKNVRLAYGEPKYTQSKPERHWIADFYCINEKKLEIHYKDSLVSGLSIGYFLPMPEDTFSACN